MKYDNYFCSSYIVVGKQSRHDLKYTEEFYRLCVCKYAILRQRRATSGFAIPGARERGLRDNFLWLLNDDGFYRAATMGQDQTTPWSLHKKQKGPILMESRGGDTMEHTCTVQETHEAQQ